MVYRRTPLNAQQVKLQQQGTTAGSTPVSLQLQAEATVNVAWAVEPISAAALGLQGENLT